VTNYALKFAALLSADAVPSMETVEEEPVDEENPMEEDHTEEVLISDQEEPAAHEVPVKDREELWDNLLKDFRREKSEETYSEYDEWTDEEEDGWSDEEEEDLLFLTGDEEPTSHQEPESSCRSPFLFVQEEEPAQHEAIDEEEEEAFDASLESLHIHEEEEEKDAVNEHYRDTYRSWLKRRSICDEQQIDFSASESQLLGSGNCDHYYRNQEQGRRYSSCDDFAASDSKLLPGPHSYQEQDFTEAAQKTSAFRKGLKVLGKFKPMKYIGRRTVIQNKCPIDCPDIMGTESPKTVLASSLLSSNYDVSLTNLFDDEDNDLIFER